MGYARGAPLLRISLCGLRYALYGFSNVIVGESTEVRNNTQIWI